MNQLMSSAVEAGGIEGIDDHVGDHADGMLEHLAAFHPEMADRLGRAGTAIDEQLRLVAAVRAQMRRQHAAIGRSCRAAACASSTTAPAPSPNSTQVPRSLQSRMREKVSAPITSARL